VSVRATSVASYRGMNQTRGTWVKDARQDKDEDKNKGNTLTMTKTGRRQELDDDRDQNWARTRARVMIRQGLRHSQAQATNTAEEKSPSNVHLPARLDDSKQYTQPRARRQALCQFGAVLATASGTVSFW